MENQNLEFYLCKFSSSSSPDEASNSLLLPPLLKRKLSRLDKMAFYTLQECASEIENPQIIFASRWGEFDRLLKLISQYKADNEVSPNAFSSSVHNFPVSYFSILNKITSAYSSLASGKDTFSLGFISAIASIGPNSPVIFNYSDVFSYNGVEEYKSVSCVLSSFSSGSARHLILKQAFSSALFDYQDFISFLEGKTSHFVSKYFTLEEVK